jgi:hypothetical protein
MPFIQFSLPQLEPLLVKLSKYCLTTEWTSGVRSPAKTKDFSSSLCVQTSWGPPSLLSNGYRGSFLGGKERPGRDADHSPRLVPRSRMSRSYTPLPLSTCMACTGQLYFYFFFIIFGGGVIKFGQIRRQLTVRCIYAKKYLTSRRVLSSSGFGRHDQMAQLSHRRQNDTKYAQPFSGGQRENNHRNWIKMSTCFSIHTMRAARPPTHSNTTTQWRRFTASYRPLWELGTVYLLGPGSRSGCTDWGVPMLQCLPQGENCLFVTMFNWSMPFREIIAVCPETL